MPDRPARGPDAAGCEHCGQPAQAGAGEVVRCPCGSLLARRVAGGIELKCRRCKRTIIVPLDRLDP